MKCIPFIRLDATIELKMLSQQMCKIICCFSYNKLLKSNLSQELGKDLMLIENWEYRYWICNHK